MGKALKAVDLFAFCTTIAAGFVAAIAGGLGHSLTAVIAGCIAVVAPIVNRVATTRQQRAFVKELGPRSLSQKQRERLIETLRSEPAFSVQVAHNRHEAEPAQYHRQIFGALTEAGLQTQWFGGMNNNTIGIEISGNPSPEKSRLMRAFSAAGIPYLEVEFKDLREGQDRGVEVWIGANPPPSN